MRITTRLLYLPVNLSRSRSLLTILIDCGLVVVKVVPVGLLGIDGMLDGRSMAGLQQRGSIRTSNGFGFIRFGHSVFGVDVYIGGVYQKRVTGYNYKGRNPNLPRRSYYVRSRYYRPTNPNTQMQQHRRSLFGDAMRSWQALAPVDKAHYNSKATRQCRRGFNLYISEYMKYAGAIPIIKKE